MWQKLSDRTAVGPSHTQPCPETTELRETCSVEEHDGFKVWRCKQTLKRYRMCFEGHKEEVESTTTTTVRPFHSDVSGSGPSSSSAPHTGGIKASSGAVMNAAMGQMLEEFFDYATELQRSLNGPGASLEPARPSCKPWQAMEVPQENTGLFGRWFGRKNEQQKLHGNQHSLPRLAKEYSSNIQEI
eukprot:jgi/Chrzof1/13135/Cz07g21070.t1